MTYACTVHMYINVFMNNYCTTNPILSFITLAQNFFRKSTWQRDERLSLSILQKNFVTNCRPQATHANLDCWVWVKSSLWSIIWPFQGKVHDLSGEVQIGLCWATISLQIRPWSEHGYTLYITGFHLPNVPTWKTHKLYLQLCSMTCCLNKLISCCVCAAYLFPVFFQTCKRLTNILLSMKS